MPRLAIAAAALLTLAAVTPSTAQAQDFPTRPIRMVIAFPAGGPTDFVGRLIADKLKESLPQPVLIENKPGANGAIGADFVAKAEPDGHTIFLSTVGAIAITPHLRDNLPYNTLRDFAPVTLVVRNTTVAVVRAEHPGQDGAGVRRHREAEERVAAVCHDRRRLDHASRDRDVGDRRGLQIRSRALSRRCARGRPTFSAARSKASSPTCRC